MADDRIPSRDEIAEESTWDLTVLYARPEDWDNDFRRLEELAQELEAWQGSLESAGRTAAYLQRETALSRLIDRLYTYAHLKADEDAGNSDHQARLGRIRSRVADIAGRLSWAEPELLAKPEATLRAWQQAPELQDFRYPFEKLVRRKPHILPENEEGLLAGASDILSTPRRAFSLLTNADMTFPDVPDASGQPQALSQSRYLALMKKPDRQLRERAFGTFHQAFSGMRNTIGCTLAATVRTHNFIARRRRYTSALDAALTPDNIPVSLYEALLEAVHGALPSLAAYLSLRKELLQLDRLDMYDLYVPVVPASALEVPFEQAAEWVVAACRPLGAPYCDVLQRAVEERWIDIYESRGKRAGAYSSSCYDGHPYVLLNYQGTLDDVFTLAHELGHAMHSWLSNQHQPPQTASYPIFIAEIASTTNEALLLHHLLHTTEDPYLRAHLLNHACDAFRATVFRQTMFAEFEKDMHEQDAEGIPLTPDMLCNRYKELNDTYYGAVVEADPRIEIEWARIPHFYYNFYVYKYATSHCAAQIFAGEILQHPEARDRYLSLLSAGGSADPLDLVREAGVDLSTPDAYEAAFDQFSNRVGDLEQSLRR